MEYKNSFDLIDVANVLKKRWKPIAIFLLVVLIITFLMLLFVMPKYYRSVSVVVAANPVMTDRGRLFNKNIEHLYSPYGQADDLDRLQAIAELDTVYKTLIKEFHLADYYKLKVSDHEKAIKQLKEDVTLEKTEFNQLRVIAVTKSAKLSADLANRMVEITQAIAQESANKSVLNTIQQLEKSITEVEASLAGDSIRSSTIQTNQNSLLPDQLGDLQQQLHEHKVALGMKAPALIELERAYPSTIVYKPKKLLVLVGALVSGFVFALIATLVLDRKHRGVS